MSVQANPADLSLSPLDAPSLAVRRLYALALLLALLVLPAMSIDLPLASLAHTLHHQGPGDVRKAIQLFEVFGHGIGAAMIILVVAVLDRRQRWQTARLIACSFGTGLANLVVKVLVGRSRPQMFVDAEFPESVQQTFSRWAEPTATNWALALDHGVQSFPSGHSAMAAGLAVGLAWLYPQGRYLFAVFAALAMLQRVESGAHFPSDTLAGAALGVAVATICCDDRLLGRWFDRWRPH